MEDNTTIGCTGPRNYEIVKGPSKGQIFRALEYAYDKIFGVKIVFKIALDYTGRRNDPTVKYIPARIRNLVITGIEHEDTSGKSLHLKGYCEADLRISPLGKEEYTKYRFGAIYNVDTRRGNIEFLEY